MHSNSLSSSSFSASRPVPMVRTLIRNTIGRLSNAALLNLTTGIFFGVFEERQTTSTSLRGRVALAELKQKEGVVASPEDTARDYNEFISTLSSRNILADFWQALCSCPQSVSDRALEEMQLTSYNTLSQFGQVEALRREVLSIDIKLLYKGNRSLFKARRRYNLRSVAIDTPANLIGTSAEHGVLLKRLENFKTTSSTLTEDQHTAISKIQEQLLDKPKRMGFSRNPELRERQYQQLAEKMYTALEGKSNEELEAIFCEGEGSLCELPQVCFGGWNSRISLHIPAALGLKGIAALDHALLEKRRDIVRNEISRDIIDAFYDGDKSESRKHYDDLHFNDVVNYIFNNEFCLEYFPEQTGQIVTTFYELVLSKITDALLVSLRRKYTSHYSFENASEVVKKHFSTLSLEQQDFLIDEILSCYRSICKGSSYPLLDRFPSLVKLFQRIQEHNNTECQEDRFSLLSADIQELSDKYNIQLGSLIPKQLKELLKELKTQNRRNLQLHTFSFKSNSNPAAQLRELCNKHNVPLTNKQNSTLEECTKPTLYKEILAEAVSESAMKKHIIDLNCDLLKKVMVDQDATSSTYKISKPGVNILLFLTSQAGFSESSKSHIAISLLPLYVALSSPKRKDLPKIDDQEEVLERIARGAEGIEFASDRLLEDKAFIMEVTSRFPSTISGFNEAPLDEEIIDAFIENHKEDPNTLMHLLNAAPSFENNHQKLAQVLSRLIGKPYSPYFKVAVKLFLTHPDDIRNVLDHLEPELVFQAALLMHPQALESTAVSNSIIRKLPVTDRLRAYSAFYSISPVFIRALLRVCNLRDKALIFSDMAKKFSVPAEIIDEYVGVTPTRDQALMLEALPLNQALCKNLIRASLNRAVTYTSPGLSKEKALDLYCRSYSEDEPSPQWVKDALQKEELLLGILQRCPINKADPILFAMPAESLADDQISALVIQKTSEEALTGFLMAKDLDKVPSEFILSAYGTLDSENQDYLLLKAANSRFCNELSKSLIAASTSDLLSISLTLHTEEETINHDFVRMAVSRLQPKDLQKTLETNPQLSGSFTLDWLVKDCPIAHIPTIISSMPRDFRSNPENVVKMIESGITSAPSWPRVLNAFLSGAKSDTQTIATIIAATSPQTIPRIFNAFPKRVRMSNLVQALAYKCDPNAVVQLVQHLGQELKGDVKLMTSLLDNTAPSSICDLIKNVGLPVKKDRDFILAALEKCPEDEVLDFASNIDGDHLCDTELMNKVIDKAPEDNKRAIIERMPSELQEPLIEKHVPEHLCSRKKRRKN